MGEYKCSKRTKRKLYEAARSLFEEKGYSETSLADIAEKAQVSTGTLYRHYPAKSFLLLYSADEVLSNLEGDVEALPAGMGCRDRVWSLISRGLGDSLSSNQDDVSAGRSEKTATLQLAHRTAIYSSRETVEYAYKNRLAMKGILEKELRKGIDEGEIPANADVSVLAEALTALLFWQYDLALVDPDGEGSVAAFKRKVAALLDLKAV